jgi:hypothetical protein
MNFLEIIQHSGTRSTLYNQEYEGDFIFISDTCFMLVVLISSQGMMIVLERGI